MTGNSTAGGSALLEASTNTSRHLANLRAESSAFYCGGADGTRLGIQPAVDDSEVRAFDGACEV